MELSIRLQAVADLVTPGNRLADVGTDHGYIPIYLVMKKKIPGAIAMDVNRGPLQRAKEHIQREGLEEFIETRLSDGLGALRPGEADSVVIAGMGGALTIRILQEGRSLLPDLRELVLQPQSELARVRRFLQENGFFIEDENIVSEDGKYYPMMRVIYGKKMGLLGSMEALYGPVLLKKKPDTLREYLTWEQRIQEKILRQLNESAGPEAARRRGEILEALEQNGRAQKLF